MDCFQSLFCRLTRRQSAAVHHFNEISLLFFDIYFSAKQLILSTSSVILKKNSSNATIIVRFYSKLIRFRVFVFCIFRTIATNHL